MASVTNPATFLADLKARHLLHQSTDEAELEDLLSKPTSFFVGFDPTAESLHMGSLLQLMLAKRFELAGHRPVFLVGGGTGLIGDPKLTGERPLRSEAEVAILASKIEAQITRLCGSENVRVRNNLDWLSSWSALTFLRDVGKHFSMNKLLSRSIVNDRPDGMSFTEFSFTLLQGLDFLELARREGVALQLGGSDQWGNMVSGIELARKTEGLDLHALTSPLLLKADGTKFGKTETGTLWLDGDKTSPLSLQQELFNVDDSTVETMLLQLTLIPTHEVRELMAKHESSPHHRLAQRRLAREVIEFLHGKDAVEQAEAAQNLMFGQDAPEPSGEVLTCLWEEFGKKRVRLGATIVELLLETQLCSSKSDARRTLKENSLLISGKRVGEDRLVASTDLISGTFITVRRGKKKFSVARA